MNCCLNDSPSYFSLLTTKFATAAVFLPFKQPALVYNGTLFSVTVNRLSFPQNSGTCTINAHLSVNNQDWNLMSFLSITILPEKKRNRAAK